MNSIFFHGALVFISFVSMEGVAWFTHKYIMHGPMWRIHADHHARKRGAIFQKNDLFFLFFSIPGMAGILAGIKDLDHYFWIGLGITMYGAAYFTVHDIFIHQRISFFRKTDSAYFKALRKAHKTHHKYTGKAGGECFGMLWVPWKYFRNAMKSRGES